MPKSKYVPTSDYYDSHDNTSSDISFVSKGPNEAFRLDVSELEDLLLYLRKHAHLPFTSLTDEAEQKFNQLVDLVGIYRATKSYKQFCKICEIIFKGVPIIPLTVGAYVLGRTDSSKHPCSLTKTGSMPDPEEHEECKNTVILCELIKNRFQFTVHSEAETHYGKQVAYLYIPYTNLKSFPGFSNSDLKAIRDLGAERIHLRGYTNNEEQIRLGDDLSLRDLKSRDEERIVVHKKESRHNVDSNKWKWNEIEQWRNNWWIWAIVIVVLILIIVASIIIMRRRQRQ